MLWLLSSLMRWSWPLALLVVVVNVIVPEPHYESQRQEADARARAGQYARASNIYRELAEADPYNIELHRGYLQNHFRGPRRIGRYSKRDDESSRELYERYSASSDTGLADVGLIGLGFYYAQQDEYATALDWYSKIVQKDQPYLNNSIGYALLQLERDAAAEPYFHREIALEGNVAGAYSNLARIYDRAGDYDGIERLLANAESSQHVPLSVKRKTRYIKGEWIEYLSITLASTRYTTPGVLSSLIIGAMWFIWLKRIDLFEPEGLRHKLYVLCGSFLLAKLMTTPLYDFYSFVLGINLGDGALNDLFYSVFVIGIVEELIKIIPVVAIIRWSNAVNESVDYVIYASLSGLGFAMAENMGYLGAGGLETIAGRAMSASVAHMALTSLAVSGYVYTKYSKRFQSESWVADPPLPPLSLVHAAFNLIPETLRSYVNVLLGFFAACVIHGVYDFFLVTDGFWGELAILSVVVLMLKFRLYNRLIRNALNHSEFYSSKKARRPLNLHRDVMLGALVVFCLQYSLVALYYGPSIANIDLLGALLFSWLLVVLILVDLGSFTMEKGLWLSIAGER